MIDSFSIFFSRENILTYISLFDNSEKKCKFYDELAVTIPSSSKIIIGTDVFKISPNFNRVKIHDIKGKIVEGKLQMKLFSGQIIISEIGIPVKLDGVLEVYPQNLIKAKLMNNTKIVNCITGQEIEFDGGKECLIILE
jgi:hypothetical protein